MPPDNAVLAVHSHTRKISHMLLGTSQLIKQRSFSAVLVSHQGKGQGFTLRQRIFLLSVVIFSPFSVSGMMFFRSRLFHRCRFGLMSFANLNIPGIFQTYGQFVAVYAQFYGVSHRRILYNRDLGSLYQPHIEEVLAQSPGSSYGKYGGRTSDL